MAYQMGQTMTLHAYKNLYYNYDCRNTECPTLKDPGKLCATGDPGPKLWRKLDGPGPFGLTVNAVDGVGVAFSVVRP